MGAGAAIPVEVLPCLDFADNRLPEFFLKRAVAAVVHDQKLQVLENPARKDFSGGCMVAYGTDVEILRVVCHRAAMAQEETGYGKWMKRQDKIKIVQGSLHLGAGTTRKLGNQVSLKHHPAGQGIPHGGYIVEHGNAFVHPGKQRGAQGFDTHLDS